jgi:hypothetical protein
LSTTFSTYNQWVNQWVNKYLFVDKRLVRITQKEKEEEEGIFPIIAGALPTSKSLKPFVFGECDEL